MTVLLIVVFMIGIPLALLAVVWMSAAAIVRHGGFKALAVVALAIVVASTMAWEHWKLRHALQALPEPLEVSSMTYSKEEQWGIGLPGDNETGLRVFPLGAAVAGRIEEQGIRYLNAMASTAPTTPSTGRDDRWRRQYTDWRETPMWNDVMAGRPEDKPLPSLEAYLGQYDFGVEIDPDIAQRVNAILRSPGSYYARGRTGVLVISPRERLVIYMYAG